MGGRAARDPDTPYFHLFDDAVPYGRLWRESARYAAGLRRAGIDRGDKVCLIYPTCAEFFYTFFGALRLGAVPVPLYPTLGVETTAAIFRDSEAVAVATIGWFRSGVDESCALAPNVRMVLEPPDHDMGLIGCAFTPPLLGTPIWLLPPDLRNPRHWLTLITEIRATFTVSPDFGYRNCVRNVRDTTGLDLGSLKAALSGAAPVRLSTIEVFESHFGLKRIISPCYGLAEATLAVAIWPRGVPLRRDASGRFLSVGQPCRGVSVKILAPLDEGTDERPAGVEGEICVKSPGVMKGYYNNPEATAKVLMPGGWLRTGDLGFVDAEGFLYVTGRLKDLIILGGANVIPADIEEVVDRVDGVRYSAAVGIDSERTGTQRLHVVAEVRSEDAAPDDYHDLIREIASRVHRASGHRPARVILVRSSTIPKTSSGKIQHSRLVQMIQDDSLDERVVYGD